MYIFTAYITSKDGRRLYAKQYGMKAFRIWIDDDRVKNKIDSVCADNILLQQLKQPSRSDLRRLILRTRIIHDKAEL